MAATIEILSAIREGNETIMETIYNQNRGVFLAWAQRSYQLDTDELVDIYQDAVIILYQNVVEEKITELRSSLQTYLFGIAKNLILKALRKKRQSPRLVDDIPEVAVSPQFFHQANQKDLQIKMREALAVLGPVCRQLLEYYYYYDFGLEVIAQRMHYKNANTAKAQKHRCMKQLEAHLKAKTS